MYAKINTSQGVFINDSGRVFVEYPFGDFPANLNGIPFEDLMKRVRSAMQS